MTIIRSKKDRHNPYVQISRKMLDDSNISLKAKGFIAYCLSKTDDWTFYVEQLASVLKEKKSAIYSAIKEAILNGYCIKHQPRDDKGRVLSFEYIISDSKEELQRLTEELKICLPKDENRKAVNEPSFSNIEIAKKNELKKCLPLTDCPQADNRFAENQQLIKNNNNKNNNNNIVCSESPVANSNLKNSVVISHPSGTQQSITIDDIYILAVQKREKWTVDEIQKVWNILLNYKSDIRDLYLFTKGTIKNLSIKEKSEQINHTKNTKIQNVTKKQNVSKKQDHSSEKENKLHERYIAPERLNKKINLYDYKY